MPAVSADDSESSFLWRVFIAGLVVLGLIAAAFFLWYGIRILLLVFLGVLLSIALSAVGTKLAQRTGMPRGLAVGLSFLLVLTVLMVFIAFFIPSVIAQTQELSNSLRTLLTYVESQRWMSALGTSKFFSQLPSLVSFEKIAALFTTTYSVVLEFFLVLFIALALAFEPQTYVRGFLALIPPSHRLRMQGILTVLHRTLEWWLFGQLLTMIGIGVFVAIGLSIVGMPLALSLAFLAAILEFIPTLGPFLAAVPAFLLALPRGWVTVLSVVLVYVLAHFIENYLLVPFVQRRTISVPPVVAVVSILFFGSLFGILGILLAMPITACVFALVRSLYLGEEAMPTPPTEAGS